MWLMMETQENYETWPDEKGRRQYIPGLRSGDLFAFFPFRMEVGTRLPDLLAQDPYGDAFLVPKAIVSKVVHHREFGKFAVIAKTDGPYYRLAEVSCSVCSHKFVIEEEVVTPCPACQHPNVHRAWREAGWAAGRD